MSLLHRSLRLGLWLALTTTSSGCALIMQQARPEAEFRLQARGEEGPPQVVSLATTWAHSSPLTPVREGEDWVYRANRSLGYRLVLAGGEGRSIPRRLRPEVGVEAGVFLLGASAMFTPLLAYVPPLNNMNFFLFGAVPMVLMGGASLGTSLVTGLLWESPQQRLEPLLAQPGP